MLGLQRIEAVLLACLACCGCGGEQVERVGNHRFAIAAKNRIPASAWPAFLPRSSDDGISFVLNPNAALPERIIVGVDARESVCRRAAGGPADVNATICSTFPLRWRGRRLYRSGDEVFWQYAPSPSGTPVIARCSPASKRGNGLCQATLPLGDLILTLHLNDSELPRLEADYDAAASLLHGWER
jgi:hypothetical protein